ncbi:serine hydrolase [Streptomyces sp. NPDC094144]|uniref:serine hydrolase n=1 Tax=Streptomyces sp. NPDC094144 TaxID=3366056 RepID=UPI0037F1F505
MVVHRGHVVAEGWWAPYAADRPHLLYSLTKSFTSIAVGLAIGDGLLSPDDRVVDVLPDRVPARVSEQGRRITVHHLLSTTSGHPTDSRRGVGAGTRRPRRRAGERPARPAGRRGRRPAGQHLRRRSLRHHHPAPRPAGRRRRPGAPCP